MTLYVHCSGSLETELSELAELILGYILEMVGDSVMSLYGETKLLLLCSPRAELFKLIELHLGDGLEMTGHSAITLGETAVMVDSYHGLLCLCV